jgi:hypothetical protein
MTFVPMTLRAVQALVEGLAGVEVGTKWGRKTWMVGGHGFAWERPLGKADIDRLGDERIPRGDIVAISVGSLDAKDALLSMELPGFFTIQHFNGFPAMLIELALAQAKHVRAAITDAHRTAAARPPAKPKSKRARKRPASARRSRRAR